MVSCEDAPQTQTGEFSPQTKQDFKQSEPIPKIAHAALVYEQRKRRWRVAQDISREFAVFPAGLPSAEPGAQYGGVMQKRRRVVTGGFIADA